MTKSRLALAFTTAALVAVAHSHPAHAQTAPFCKEMGFFSSFNFSAKDFADVKMTEDEATEVAEKFGNMMCTSGVVTDRDKIMAIRTTWMKTLGIDERDFLVLAALSNARTYPNQDLRSIPGPVSQISNGYASKGLVELDQLGARASMVARFTVVDRCLQETAERMPLLRHILCTREPLDVAKAYAELDATAELNNGTRYQLRKLIRSTAAIAAAKRAEIDAKAKDDPGIAKAVAIADAQFKEWASPSPERAKLIAQLEAMEAATDANKHSAFAGCEATTHAAWEQRLKGLKLPKVPSEHALSTFIAATLDSPESYLAFQAMRLCSASSEENLRRGLEIIGSDVIRRGPRTATVAAWMAAAADIKFDDRGLKMNELLANGNLPLTTSSSFQSQRNGAIAAISDVDGGVEITFKRVVEPREDCLKYRETNHIESISSDGTIRYRGECLKWGMVKMDLTAQPIRVGKLLAQGLKPGMYLVAIEGTAIAATAGAKSTKPVWVFGGSVK